MASMKARLIEEAGAEPVDWTLMFEPARWERYADTDEEDGGLLVLDVEIVIVEFVDEEIGECVVKGKV
jgi:hypothetical protein